MDAALKLRRMEIRAADRAERIRALGKVGEAGVDLAKAALANPGLGMALSVAGVEALARWKLINETERGLLAAVVISSDLLKAFTPVRIVNG